MLHACVQRFDVTGTVQKNFWCFWHLNRPIVVKDLKVFLTQVVTLRILGLFILLCHSMPSDC
jgi:hypothetical protein